MEVRFAGDEASLGELMEEELIRAIQLELMAEFMMRQEQERMREVMRLRTDKLTGTSPLLLMEHGWVSGAEGMENVYAPPYEEL
jgi:hypothetical protein